MSPFDLQIGRDYDLKHDSLHVMADRDGCEVFEVGIGDKTYRVLAHTQAEADECLEPDYGDVYFGNDADEDDA